MTSSWTDPGVFEVSPGVHRIPLPLPNDGLRAVNVYVITTAEGLTLIDAGWAIPESRATLERGLGELGAGIHDIRDFLVTHVHRDHYSQATALRRELGTRVSLGLGERPTLDYLIDDSRKVLESEVRLLRTLGAGELADQIDTVFPNRPSNPEGWELPDRWLEDEILHVAEERRLHAVQTPGHTAGHVVFHDLEAKILFAGDHVLPTITPSIGFEPVRSPDPLGSFLKSLALVRSRPDATLLPAHGPVTDSVHARVDELIAHHGARLDEIEAAALAGAHTPFANANVLRWTRHERRLSELDPFNAMLAVCETGAHLELLAAQGRLTKTTVDGVSHFA